MKLACTVIAIGSLLAISIFGIFAMSHGPGHSHNGCIAATAEGADCPKGGGALLFVTFHLNALRSFSTATFNDDFASALLLFAMWAFVIIFGVMARSSPDSRMLATNCYRNQFLGSHSFPRQREFAHWLALHENSPSVL